MLSMDPWSVNMLKSTRSPARKSALSSRAPRRAAPPRRRGGRASGRGCAATYRGRSARAGNRHFRLLSALRAHTELCTNSLYCGKCYVRLTTPGGPGQWRSRSRGAGRACDETKHHQARKSQPTCVQHAEREQAHNSAKCCEPSTTASGPPPRRPPPRRRNGTQAVSMRALA